MRQPQLAASPDQPKIITAPLAPLRVIAGAGTGKTATIAHRVAHLVEAYGLAPEEILGVTFTNKAASELSQRIRTALGTDKAHDVEVHTYHGFGAQVISEFGPLVGIDRHVQIITPAFTRQLLFDVVSRHPLHAFDPTSRGAVESLRRLSSALSDHLLRPGDIQVPEPPDEVWKKRAEMLSVLSQYEEVKRRLNILDYGDLIRSAYELCIERPEIARRLRARYRAVICDEYQDTNPAQRELLRVLFRDEVPVTVVGDPDQTIYEWRGASLENLDRFNEHFGDGPTIPLIHSHRSGPEILDVANLVRNRVDARPRPPLVAAEGAEPSRVRCGWFDTASEEADWIAQEIERLHDHGYLWSDMSILFRKNRDMYTVHRALSDHGIPFEVANLGGLLDIPEVVDLWAWLRLIEDPADSVAAVRILVGGRFQVGLGDLGQLQRWIRARDARLKGEGSDHLPGHTLIEAIEQAPADDRLKQFLTEYRRLVTVAQGSSLVELCRAVLDVTGAWAELDAMESTSGLSARLNLYRFLDLAEEWSPLEGRPSLHAFLNHLGSMKEEGADELDTARLSGADAVNLMTVHRAKGLEWPAVFIPAAHGRNFPSSGRRDNPFRHADALPFELRLDTAFGPQDPADLDMWIKERELSQEWRVAYVAVTRAKRILTVTGSHWYGHPRPLKRPVMPGAFFELVSSMPTTETVRPVGSVPPRPSVHDEMPEVGTSPDPLFTDSWTGALRSQLSDPRWASGLAAQLGIRPAYDVGVAEFQEMLFRLPEPMPSPTVERTQTSVTGLVTYATCPRRYYWTSVDPLPVRMSYAARRGTAVHRQIELHNLGFMALDEANPEAFRTSQPGSSPFGTFLNSRFAHTAPVAVEAPFELALESGARVRGRIDAIYDHGKRTEIVDFKTGRYRQDPALTLQLETYAIAARDVALGVPVHDDLTVTFAFLGEDQVVEETHQADERWLSNARGRVSSLAESISSTKFDPAPGNACLSCDFFRFCDEGKSHVGDQQ